MTQFLNKHLPNFAQNLFVDWVDPVHYSFYVFKHSSQTGGQCDQMTRLFVQYLAVYNNGNLPKSVPNFPK